MRQTGTLDNEQDARRFADYLLTQGIHARVEQSNAQWIIWVYDENELARSKQQLAEFIAQPGDARYQSAAQTAEALRREAIAQEKQARKNVIEMRDRWRRPAVQQAPLTMALIATSVLVAVLTQLGQQMDPVGSYLRISTHAHDLSDILSGEIWRLITPIFLHFSILHLLFNMYWTYALGGTIEIVQGTRRLALLVLISAVVSNLAQFFFVGANFGGMSGVVYGLFGYIWMKSRVDPGAGLHMDPNTAFWMLAWMFLCMTPMMPMAVANAAHVAGLLAGLALGFIPRLGK